jgi:hypothetical protein
MVGWFVYELEKIWRDAVVPQFGYYHGICLGTLRKATKIFSHGSRYFVRDSRCGEEKYVTPLPAIKPRFIGRPARNTVVTPSQISRLRMKQWTDFKRRFSSLTSNYNAILLKINLTLAATLRYFYDYIATWLMTLLHQCMIYRSPVHLYVMTDHVHD